MAKGDERPNLSGKPEWRQMAEGLKEAARAAEVDDKGEPVHETPAQRILRGAAESGSGAAATSAALRGRFSQERKPREIVPAAQRQASDMQAFLERLVRANIITRDEGIQVLQAGEDATPKGIQSVATSAMLDKLLEIKPALRDQVRNFRGGRSTTPSDGAE